MFHFFKNLFADGASKKELINEALNNAAILVDVRSESEFRSGNVKGSVNIHLQKLNQELSKLKNKNGIVVFCQSGARSAQAKRILEQNGFQDVINGGGWMNVNQIVRERAH